MAYLFDTDAISELLRRQPIRGYLDWLARVPRAEQFTSTVVIGELYKGAFRSREAARHIQNIETRVLTTVTVLPYDVEAARVFGRIEAKLAGMGRGLADADLQIAATAIHHGLELVTGNLAHLERVPALKICPVLAEARRGGRMDEGGRLR